MNNNNTAVRFHLPGLFEQYDFYKAFLPLFYSHRGYFYDDIEIGSLYGAPYGCIWGGGRFGEDNGTPENVLALTGEYGISARLTFSNSLLKAEHLSDKKCNRLCALFENGGSIQNGVIIHSDLLLDYLKRTYPALYFVSSTTKVLTDFKDFKNELLRDEFRFVVPDFRLNKRFADLNALSPQLKSKVEFLCNECCSPACTDRKACYENVSRRILGEDCPEFICRAPGGGEGYVFSKAMNNPLFIGKDDIFKTYMQNGFSEFKIEGRGLGSALLLEFLLYYTAKPEYHLKIREKMYLNAMLDLF